jgi:hypothetical protein
MNLPYYLTPDGIASIKAASKALGDDLEARRLLRATAQRLDITDRRHTVDKRGAVTVISGGWTVIRPRSDLARFDRQPADVTAFMLDDQMRGEAQ